MRADAIRGFVSAGVVVAIGHTDATYDQARAALDAGAAVGTHLFNAMRGLHHREPGPVAALLEHPDAYVELIADGVHVHPAMVGLAAAAKPQHTVLVTDAMAAAAAEDGDYRLGSLGGRGPRRRRPAAGRRGDRRLDDDHGRRRSSTPYDAQGSASRTPSGRRPPPRPRCTA